MQKMIRRMQNKLFMGTIVVNLGLFGVSPIFRDDLTTKWIGGVCVCVLTILNLLRVIKPAARQWRDGGCKPRSDELDTWSRGGQGGVAD